MSNIDIKEEIIEIDNFLPIFLHTKLISLFYNTTMWSLEKSRTYDIRDIGFKRWKENNLVQDHDTFIQNLDLESTSNSYIILNLKKISEQKFNIEIDTLFRVRYVYTPPDPLSTKITMGYPHVDAKYEHYTILYYLVNNDANTVFFNQKYISEEDTDYSKQEIIKQVVPKANKAVLFNGLIFHAGNVSNTMKRLTVNLNFTLKK